MKKFKTLTDFAKAAKTVINVADFQRGRRYSTVPKHFTTAEAELLLSKGQVVYAHITCKAVAYKHVDSVQLSAGLVLDLLKGQDVNLSSCEILIEDPWQDKNGKTHAVAWVLAPSMSLAGLKL